ncbi:chorismate-binding protein [Macrococcus equipercicus]|uniref:Chorismate-binding protein n=1 Tax=Macrococcus equipercicus TaxID=69967 RepID=A0A9Q9F204_9STAP|nr:chorismate-binding protein [Macrococcus equipercicus]UTH14305.1 chorismate-binding protein [Macrococcus equipercicus]
MIRACVHFISLTDHQPIDYYFENPVKVLKAGSPAEVPPVLQEAERYSRDHYVVGYMAYEAAAAWSDRMSVKEVETYAAFYVFDAPVAPFEGELMTAPMTFEFETPKAQVIEHIAEIQEEIRRGNTYQVNYTVRLKSVSDNVPYAVYQLLTRKENGHYTCYIEEDEAAVISISPELFFEHDRQSGRIYTKPMKGTMPRTAGEDNAHQLLTSTKDRAENVMIVDLLRNDLSRIALKNTVTVSSLFEITAYPTVYQMTSTIEAVLPDTITLNELFAALYPCGSITGAPKISTMTVIDRLEDSARSVYCGACGIMLPDGRTIFNVPIRTLVKDGKSYTYGVGGGITIDSLADKEYEEMEAKSHILDELTQSSFHLIETMRIDDTGVKRRDYHLDRLTRSLQHFNMSWHARRLNSIMQLTNDNAALLRVTAASDKLFYEIKELPPAANKKAVLRLMDEEDEDRLLYKTSCRDHYTADKDSLSLYYDKRGYITEFNIGNVVYELDGEYYTPGTGKFLRGCMRQELLDKHIIKVRDLTLNEYENKKEALKFWMINSLREWTVVRIESEITTINGNS